MKNTADKIAIDIEWVELIKQAKRLGITEDEIRLFLKTARNKQK
ncbi:anti-repressor SinI family protein [Virgibacillus sp. NKC19-3]|nr:anti-repressor SinI family protein [Virgibacillus sp. NKC19-3]MBY7144125.1 anti-repressor SinI family protein [Virgibacillus sp. NKC19-3]